MRRNVVGALALAAAAAAPLAAQQASFGIVGGYVSASPSLTPSDPNIGSRSGFAAGGYVEFRVARSVDFAPEVMYLQRGSTDGTVTTAADYIEVPVLLRLNMGAPSRMRPFLTVGPSFGFNLSCNYTGTIGTASASEACDAVDANSGVKSTDVSLMFGLGVASRRASFSVRYDLGLTDIDKTDPPTIKSRDLLILLGLRL